MKINEVKKHHGEIVEIRGFVKQIRDLKKMQFLVIYDITESIQVTIFKDEAHAKLNEIVSTLTPESSVKIKGEVNVSDFVKLNGVEILPTEIEIANLANSPLPIDMTDFSESNRDLRLDWRFLDLRSKEHQLIFRVQTTLEMAMREYLTTHEFIEIHSPKLVGSPSESGAELFSLDYFGGKAYLAQSPQLYKQMAIASGFEKVFEIGPVFRANKSHTSRHDTEFTSIDFELAWINSYEDVMKFEEEILQYTLKKVKEKHGEEIKNILGQEVIVPTLPFPRIPMAEARKIVESMGYTIPPETKGDLDPTAEKMIGEYALNTYGSQFVFITEFPTSIRPFYHMYKVDDKSKTCSYDLLWGGLEITTGAQREHRYEILVRQGVEKGAIPKNVIDKQGNILEEKLPVGMKAYLETFNYGMPPHGGFALGLTRILMILLGYSNVREVTYIYRGVDRLTP